jgi:hypothetical protein
MGVQSWPDAGRWLAELSNTAGRGPLQQGWIGPPEDDPLPADLDGTLDEALAGLSARTGRRWTRDEFPLITQRVLDRSVSGPRRPRGVEYALRFPQLSNLRAGFLTWDPERLKAEARDEPPVITGSAPRLFLSYRWSEAADVNAIIDHYASTLWDLGYDIAYDRDPRHLDKQLTAGDVLLMLPGSTHYVVLLTQELIDFVTRDPREPLTPLDLEWQLALRLRTRANPLRWLGIWYSGDQLPAPLTRDAVAELRQESLDLGPLFPECRFQLTATTRGGTQTPRTGLLRRELAEAVAEARSAPGVVTVDVQDVTERAGVWSYG